MQKVLDFLEKYCQWLAVGLAALFFLFALYQFLPGVAEPVAVELEPGHRVGPSEADVAIKDKAEQLQQRMGETGTIPTTVPAYSKSFEREFTGAGTPPKPALAEGSFFNVRFDVPKEWGPIAPNPGNGTDESDSSNITKVSKLPEIPAATIETPPTSGFSQIPQQTAEGGAAADAAAAPASPAAPVATAGKPGAPAATPGTPTVPSQDVTWVRVPYTIPMVPLRVSFGGVGIPPTLSKTSVVYVELVRQKQLAGNEWAPEEVVKRFSVTPLRDMPPADAAVPVLQDYRTWAEQNEQLLVQPAFYQILAGENPNVLKAAAAAPAPEVFDPTTFPRNGDVSKLTPDQRKAVLAARKEAEKNKPKPTPGPRGGGSRGGGPRGPGGYPGAGGGEMAPQQALPSAAERTGRMAEPMQNRPGMPPAGRYPGAPTGAGGPGGYPGAGGPGGYPGMRPGGYPGGPPGGEDPGMNGENGMQPPTDAGTPIQLAPLPSIPFDPMAPGATDIQGVAYDTTAQGDATYRYRVRYFLANPLYQAQGIAAAGHPEVTNTFALKGEDPTKWSDPVQIAPLTHFYLAQSPQPGATQVKFTVYRWQNGQQHRALQTFSLGDSIGKPDAGIDYGTAWTLVEVRKDSSADGPYVVLMNSEGRVRRQTFTADQADPEQKRLATQVDAAAKAATPAGAGTPGASAAQ